MKWAYYNEFDPFAAQWLRELIADGLIAQGEVDERSILDVRPADLKGYAQHHFFAGIGGWSYALRLAGWPDDSAVWTGSCPCQPFSSAGKRTGTSDERHLWPAFFDLIEACRPPVVFGEQVASSDVIGPTVQGLWQDKADYGVPGSQPRRSQMDLSLMRERMGSDDKALELKRKAILSEARISNAAGAPSSVGREAAAKMAGWPTPMAGTPAQNGNNAAGNNDSSRKTVELVSGWPTPNSRENGGGDYTDPEKALARTVGGKHQINLSESALLAGWATPTALDAKQRDYYSKGGLALPGQAKTVQTALTAGWATPRQSDGSKNVRTPEGAMKEANRKGGNNDLGTTAALSPAPTASKGASLNPAFSRWLQGYPEGWCQAAIRAHRKRTKAGKRGSGGSAATEMASSRKSRPSS